MSEHTAMFLIASVRSVATCLAVAGAVWLAYHEKKGWGWMIFLALCLGSFSVKLGSEL